MSQNGSRSRLSLSFRLGVTAAAAVLLTAGCLSPLVEGHRWIVDVVVAVGAVTVTGLIMRELTRWRLPVVLVQAFSLFVTVTALFARDFAVAGVLPSPGAWRQLRLLIDQGVAVTRDQAPPVESAPGVLVLVVLGIGVVALLTDATAATWRRPALAGLPLLAVYCVPAAVLVDGLAWPWFLLASGGFLLLVAADSADRVRAWGRLVNAGTSASADRVRLGVLPGSSGVRAGAAAVAAALLLPVALPGLRDPLFGGSGLGEGRGPGRGNYVNPILDLRKNLTSRSDEIALRMRTDTPGRPPMLRIAVDENFDGKQWTPRKLNPPLGQQVARGMPAIPGLDSAVATTKHRVDIRIAALNQNYLPLPYPSTRVDASGDWRYDAATLDVVGKGVRTGGLSYNADYLEVGYSAQRLLDNGALTTVAMEPYLKLPTLPKSIADLAKQKAGAGTDFEKAANLQAWFRSTAFQYTVQAPGNGIDDGGLDVMEEFLRDKRGYCVHFASAMAVMARTLNIPSRVAVGFLPPDPGENGEYVVKFARAHAWPELYFRGSGWVRFEPTPPTRSGVAPAWTVPTPDMVANPSVPITTPAQVPDGTRSLAPAQPEAPGRDGTSLSRTGGLRLPWWVLGFVPLPLVVLIPRTVAMARRRRRWARAAGPVELAELGWQDLRIALGDLGSTWPSSATPRQVRRLLVDRHDLSVHEEAPLGRLVADLESARYARPGSEPGVRDAGARRADVGLVRRAVAERTERSRRLRAVWWPSSGVASESGRAGRGSVEQKPGREVDSGSTRNDPVGAGGRRAR